MHNMTRASSTCQNSEKLNDPIQRKHMDIFHNRKMGRLYLTEPFRLSQGVQQVQLQ